MKLFITPPNELLVLAKGEQLMDSLMQYAIKAQHKSAWLQGIGAASSATVGAYNYKTKGYDWKIYNEPLELLSLQGNLSWVDQKPFWHIHAILSTTSFQAVGGHLKELEIGVTAELLITPLASSLTRALDHETGIKLLHEA
jgi:uncharacterized protein